MKLYLDGCSFTYGLGLEAKDTLASLFTRNGYTVNNQARNGKSNLAIVMDAYKNFHDHDVVVLGFTYSGRFHLRYQDIDLDFQPNFYPMAVPRQDYNSAGLEQAYENFHKYFYTLYQAPFCDELSDCIIDNLCTAIRSAGKTLVAFSWEQRKIKNTLIYPYIGPDLRLPDMHLNATGTQYLFDLLQEKIATQ